MHPPTTPERAAAIQRERCRRRKRRLEIRDSACTMLGRCQRCWLLEPHDCLEGAGFAHPEDQPSVGVGTRKTAIPRKT